MRFTTTLASPRRMFNSPEDYKSAFDLAWTRVDEWLASPDAESDDLMSKGCPACDLAITRRCAELRMYGEVRIARYSDHNLQMLLQAARAGCRDCSLICGALEHVGAKGESWTARLHYEARHDREGALQLQIHGKASDQPESAIWFSIFRSLGT